ncbi:hypothetical protein C8Q76DRAFT_700100 [Earliella scabrosa]|nr:hypothetical protein C8Q76DRAFT_700100 [Earliella scabrosa]
MSSFSLQRLRPRLRVRTSQHAAQSELQPPQEMRVRDSASFGLRGGDFWPPV